MAFGHEKTNCVISVAGPADHVMPPSTRPEEPIVLVIALGFLVAECEREDDDKNDFQERTCMEELDDLGKAFIQQARDHLQEDFLPKIRNASKCWRKGIFGGEPTRITIAWET